LREIQTTGRGVRNQPGGETEPVSMTEDILNWLSNTPDI